MYNNYNSLMYIYVYVISISVSVSVFMCVLCKLIYIG